MPIYEYQCESCDHHLEVIQKVSDAPLRECPACKKQSLKKLISAAAFHLKGTGWYETDFKGKPKAKDETNKDKTPAKDNDKKPEQSATSSDSKTKTKSESTPASTD